MTRVATATTTSQDGTTIAWSRSGSGPALVMVECVGASRESSPATEIYAYADRLVAAMPDAVTRVLPGEWHGVDDATLTEAVRDFLIPPL